MAILMIGLGIPTILDYLNHEMTVAARRARQINNEESNTNKNQPKDQSQSLALLFIAIAYYLGYLMT